jgi:hypothetical protein
MSNTELIIVAVVVVVLIALIASRSGGPRVTEITRTIEKDKDGTDA